MDYETLIENLVFWSKAFHVNPQARDALEKAAKAITDLLERAEVAEARCKAFEKMVREYQNVIVPGYRERAEKAEHALAHMWYAYQNKDEDCPHEHEKEAVSQAEKILGMWEDVMQNMMKEE